MLLNFNFKYFSTPILKLKKKKKKRKDSLSEFRVKRNLRKCTNSSKLQIG